MHIEDHTILYIQELPVLRGFVKACLRRHFALKTVNNVQAAVQWLVQGNRPVLILGHVSRPMQLQLALQQVKESLGISTPVLYMGFHASNSAEEQLAVNLPISPVEFEMRVVQAINGRRPVPVSQSLSFGQAVDQGFRVAFRE